MSILFVEGFDSYNGVTAAGGLVAGWPSSVTTNISMVTGRFGGQAVSIGAATGASTLGARPTRTFAATSQMAFGAAVYRSSNPSGISADLSILSGTPAVMASISFTSTGAINVYRGDVSVQLGSTTAAGVVPLNSWVYLEIEYVPSTSSGGSLNIYIDGVSVFTISAAQTSSAGTSCAGICIGSRGTSGSANVAYWDDIYVNNTSTRSGVSRVETLRPSADTAQKDWTPDTGTANYSRVNETLSDDDTSYVQASTVGNQDLYSFGSLSSTPASIAAVQVSSIARRTDANSRSIAHQVKSSTSTSTGGNTALGSSYAKALNVFETDPATSAAWAAAGVNALSAGPRVTV